MIYAEVFGIHKIQGFDLNYAGVIFGKEVYYDKIKLKLGHGVDGRVQQ